MDMGRGIGPGASLERRMGPWVALVWARVCGIWLWVLGVVGDGQNGSWCIRKDARGLGTLRCASGRCRSQVAKVRTPLFFFCFFWAFPFPLVSMVQVRQAI
ncbi:hypothetical protein LZ30DRAFT_719904 [Colletotrichum cereale]|nr:hypothetical protein LZ30DRAFT_719904 [Colletotrichum cereale]